MSPSATKTTPSKPITADSRRGCSRCAGSNAWHRHGPLLPGTPSCRTCAAATTRSFMTTHRTTAYASPSTFWPWPCNQAPKPEGVTTTCAADRSTHHSRLTLYARGIAASGLSLLRGDHWQSAQRWLPAPDHDRVTPVGTYRRERRVITISPVPLRNGALQHLGEERLRSLLLRIGEHLARWAGFDDDAAVHEHHLVGDFAGEAHLVGHDDHRHAVDRELPHHVEHLADQLRVERGRRLVEEHQLGIHGQRTRDRHPLLLPAGELRRVGLLFLRKADPVEELAR